MNAYLLKLLYRQSSIGLAMVATGLAAGPAWSQPADNSSANSIQTYTVNKKVSAFPTNEDLSTPEAAYATWNRSYAAQGEAAFAKLSVRRLAVQLELESRPAKPLPAAAASARLNSEILEVRIYSNLCAGVIARVANARKTLIDLRAFERENGRWLNAGQDIHDNLDAARAKFAMIIARQEAERTLSSRPPVANPKEHLRPFIEFLEREGADPQEFLLRALAGHRVVILGEVHHRPRYWAFNTSLVRAARFPKQAGVIYMELPSNDQALVDRFLAAPKYDPQPVIEMLRDMLLMGWPDQPMLDFFKTVWEVNQTLPKQQRLRIVLVDMARPWKEIQKREDWRKYDVDREQLMADNIARDLREHAADSRHALFIVGYMHATVNLSYPSGDAMKSAGWHLRAKLGEAKVFAVFPHSVVMANMGRSDGRLALGLFETAFAALHNRPMAFPLDHGPFSKQTFDASLDDLTTDPYRKAFQAYLYLGPLEDEVFSPLIPRFYSDEFVRELDRRSRVMFGKGLVEAHGIKTADAQGVRDWMSAEWGQPRREWSVRHLGPLNLWELGSGWEEKLMAAKLQNWSAETNAIKQAAARLFDAIRTADYEKPRSFPALEGEYRVDMGWDLWVLWICQHFRTNPIVSVDLGEVFKNEKGRATVPYKLTQKDGDCLQGNLPFYWNARAQSWSGDQGIDWHLQKPQTTR